MSGCFQDLKFFSLVLESLIFMCPGVDLNVFGFPSRVFIFRGFKDIVWQYPQRTTFSPKISQ